MVLTLEDGRLVTESAKMTVVYYRQMLLSSYSKRRYCTQKRFGIRLHNYLSAEMQFQPTLRSFYIQLWFLVLPRCCKKFSLVRGRRKQRKKCKRWGIFWSDQQEKSYCMGHPRRSQVALRSVGNQELPREISIVSRPDLPIIIGHTKLVIVNLQVW